MKSSPPSTNVIVSVAVPSPLRRAFDYLVPQDINFVPVIGARVVVPFGRQTLIGIILDLKNSSTLAIEKLKPITQILDQQPLFSTSLLELLHWASNYYQYPIGMLFDAALPGWLRKQQSLEIPATTIPKTIITANSFELNNAQQTAIAAVQSSFGTFKTFLLDGVTGSGKTEVYMQLIAAALQQQKQVLMLIPEINLTPQTLQRFEERFKTPIAVLHSQISEKKRAMAWLQAKAGVAPIILGTRLAAFTPLLNPGLFIIDEEHDLSFKQQDHFRYSARDLLLKRAQLEHCPVVLGTATPSLETWQNVNAQKYQHLILPERAGKAVKPEIEIIDVRHKQLQAGISNNLLAQIKQHLDNKGQVLLFLNRRGYAPVLMCFNCGWHQSCKRCDSNMIFHYNSKILRCHHCEAKTYIPDVCPECKDPGLNTVGLGTQQIEASLKMHFPNANIARVDRDSINNKKQLQEMLDKVHDQTTNILIGTQMLAKGHHFPNLSLVAIVDIDSALFSADFRATERVGQLITQVAGRAGRGTKLGKVVLQTTHPDNPLLTTLIHKGYHEFLRLLLEERKFTNLPPFSYQVLFRAETKQPSKANQFLQFIKELLIQHQPKVSCLGPIAAPMEKRQGFYRAQLLLQAAQRKTLQELLAIITPKIEEQKVAKSVRWNIDVDPLDMY
jgi:primosomal protein N' (replication factor Y)